VLNYVVRSEARVDEIIADAEKAGATILKPAATLPWGGYGGFLPPPGRSVPAVGRGGGVVRGPGRLRLEHRLQRPGKRPTLRGVASKGVPSTAASQWRLPSGRPYVEFATPSWFGPVGAPPAPRLTQAHQNS